MISNMNVTTPMITFDDENGFVVVMNKALEMFSPPEELEKQKPKLKSLAASKFKKAVFRVVEHNEEVKQEGETEHEHGEGQGCHHHIKGFADIESISGDFRYKIGIIDFLTNYSNTKYLENQFKSHLHHVDRNSVSAIDEKSYQKRFVKFMSDNL